MLTLRSSLVLFALAAGPALAAPATVADIAGTVRVIDGDTLDVGETRVRLFGIDAPEQDQTCRHPTRGEWPCGAAVTETLRDWIEGAVVRCNPTGTDRYGRVLARCWLGEAEIGETLVTQGWAFAFKSYSDLYLRQERAALAAGRGLWTSVVLPPDAHRAGKRTAADQSSPQPGCAIKGNVSRDGKQIYHLPGQSFYDRTRINPAQGERWFCSEAEARMAGWRKARR